MSTTVVPSPGHRGGWFADRRVNTKLLCLLAALLVVAGSVGGLSIVQLGAVNAAADSIYSQGAVPLKDLAEAQEAKLDLITRKLRLGPDTHLLDIGCGWGSLIGFAAERYGTPSVGVTLSQRQADEDPAPDQHPLSDLGPVHRGDILKPEAGFVMPGGRKGAACSAEDGGMACQP